jgi:hypothetical protein
LWRGKSVWNANDSKGTKPAKRERRERRAHPFRGFRDLSLFRVEEREIDALVYALYGLTEDEIKIVEGKERLERE